MAAPKPPATVKVGPFDYRIIIGGKDWDDARLRENDADLIGHHNPGTLTVSMAPGLVVGAQREVLLHELLHACFNAAGQPVSDGSEEDAVRTLAPTVLALLRDNPAVVTYLLHPADTGRP